MRHDDVEEQRTFTLRALTSAATDVYLIEGFDPGLVDAVYKAICRHLTADPPVADPVPVLPSSVTQQAPKPARLSRLAPRGDQGALFGTVQPDTTARLSRYQQALMDHLAHTSSGDVLIDAVAGSGKTSTLVALAPSLQGDALFLAFNASVVKHLQKQLGAARGVTVATLHSVGNTALRVALQGPPQPQEYKYDALARQVVAGADPTATRQAAARASAALTAWAQYVRLTLTDPQDTAAVRAMVDHYGLEGDADQIADLLAWLPLVLERGEAQARDQRLIDFTDMLYLPWRWQLTPHRAAWVLVDECQDLSAAALQLAQACRAPGGRMLFVGDAHQAINGFAGADDRSIQRIEAATGARRFPLPICYRCPTSHLDLARAIVPHLEARPGAPVGTIAQIDADHLAQTVKPGDLILCRLTAPLLHQCFELLKAHISVTVAGREIGKGLTTIVRAVAHQAGFAYAKFGEAFWRYEQEQIERLSQRPYSAGRIESLEDRCNAIRTCYERFGATDVEDLCQRIAALFDNKAAQVTFSTVHRAKGSEAARVFLLKPEKMPLTWPVQQAWEYEQEQHIRYVALTRATEALFFVQD